MWLFCVQGFYSVVENQDDPGFLIVRTRVRRDLEALSEQIPDLVPFRIYDADYPWRAVVSRTQWQRALIQIAAEIDYERFQTAVAAREPGQRAEVYARVFDEIHALDDSDEAEAERATEG
jgi:hypothetical protein